MSFRSPILSSGWHHYFIGAPLSPKARVTLNRTLRGMSDQDASFKALSTSALIFPLLDLGVLNSAVEPHLIQALSNVLAPHASFKLQATGWWINAQGEEKRPIPSKDENQAGFLWLAWGERMGALNALKSDLSRSMSTLHIEGVPVETASPLSSKKKSRELTVLCGEYSRYNSETYNHPFRSAAWMNEILLQKRPTHFDPHMGYQSVWRYTLPLETPLLSETQELSSYDSLNLTRASSLEEDQLDRRSLELLQELENRLQDIPSLPPPNQTYKSMQRAHRRRKSKHPQTRTTQE